MAFAILARFSSAAPGAGGTVTLFVAVTLAAGAFTAHLGQSEPATSPLRTMKCMLQELQRVSMKSSLINFDKKAATVLTSRTQNTTTSLFLFLRDVPCSRCQFVSVLCETYGQFSHCA
jgi:hypothetical protein